MDNKNSQQAVIDKIKDSKNILVTVSNNPSVDQLSACIGLTLWLNRFGKHATAVFSGEVPNTLEFLQPEATLEKNTDSLRDFIISLDKSKADKLRYKVEDAVVKVFVTPYRTSLSADDLEFSQGDFNVDMVIALGVHSQGELDTAITAHGRILHDATVATVTIGETASELGSIGWHDAQASSLSELVVEIANALDKEKIDTQIATALLTGVVAETERFSNDKTTPQAMNISAQLMSAGASQQLVATQLAVVPKPAAEPVAEEPESTESNEESRSTEATDSDEPAQQNDNNDGSIMIAHDPEQPKPQAAHDEPSDEDDNQGDAKADDSDDAQDSQTDELQPEQVSNEDDTEQPQQVEPVVEPYQGGEPFINNVKSTGHEHDELSDVPELAHFADPTPKAGGTLTANALADDITTEQTTDPFSQPVDQSNPLLQHQSNDQPNTPAWMPPQPWMNTPVQPSDTEEDDNQMPAAQLDYQPPADTNEPALGQDTPMSLYKPADEPMPSPPAAEYTPADITPLTQPPAGPSAEDMQAPPPLDDARDEVMRALESSPVQYTPEPTMALNAQPIELDTVTPTPSVDPNEPINPELTGDVNQPFTMPLPDVPAQPTPPPATTDFDPNAPPPVPPPMPFGK